VGTSWYVIYRGSVNVVVNGVTVCSLQEGEGFGELALVNDKPRSATIIANEDDVQLIKVDKEDYNRIMSVRVALGATWYYVMRPRSQRPGRYSGSAARPPRRTLSATPSASKSTERWSWCSRRKPPRSIRGTVANHFASILGFVRCANRWWLGLAVHRATGSFVVMSATPEKLVSHLEEDHAAGMQPHAASAEEKEPTLTPSIVYTLERFCGRRDVCHRLFADLPCFHDATAAHATHDQPV